MKVCKRKMMVGVICSILILGMVALASASEVAPSHETVSQETHEPVHEAESHEAAPEVHGGVEEAGAHGEEATHGEEHAGAGEHGASHAPPLVYWFTWVFLILAVATLVQYIRNTGKEEADDKETKYHSIGYVVIIGAFVVIVVTISLLPSVVHYHESSAVGFSRFLLMIFTGFLLMTYGFREHERHKLHAQH